MQKIYQLDWFGIPFDSFTQISDTKIAGSEFYEAFYVEFYKKYHSCDELSEVWKNCKLNIARHIDDITKDKRNICSIGCGLGVIEKYLAEQLNNQRNILAIEPSATNTKWLKNVKGIDVRNGFFPDAIQNNECDIDFTYASTIDYVFNDTQYLDFLKSVKIFGIKDFLLTELFMPGPMWKYYLKECLALIGLRKRGQFWGYFRTIDEHIGFLSRAGFNTFETGKYEHGSYWIRAGVENN